MRQVHQIAPILRQSNVNLLNWIGNRCNPSSERRTASSSQERWNHELVPGLLVHYPNSGWRKRGTMAALILLTPPTAEGVAVTIAWRARPIDAAMTIPQARARAGRRTVLQN
jgi:hypothetical protein